jgi:hypothetical protein
VAYFIFALPPPLRPHARAPIVTADWKKDDYTVKIRPEMKAWSQFKADHTALKQLDLDAISVIGTVLAQTVRFRVRMLGSWNSNIKP